MSSTSPLSRPQGRDSLPPGQRALSIGHIVFNFILLCFVALMFNQAGTLPSSAWEPIGSGSFPRLMLAILATFNLMMIAKEAFRLRHTSTLTDKSIMRWLWQHRLAFGVLTLFAAYTLTLPFIGFRWSTLPFVFFCQLLLGVRRLRQLGIAILIAGIMSFGLDALFRHVFTISLPQGALF